MIERTLTQRPVEAQGLILCGGRGRRLGGIDKGLIHREGSTAAESAAALLRGTCDTVFVSANRNLDAYRALAIGPVIRDRRYDYSGPLAGIEAVAPLVSADVLLILPCDLPALEARVPADLLRALLSDPELDLAFAKAGETCHYLCAALRRRCLDRLSAELDTGQRAVRHWYKRLNGVAVEFGAANAYLFRNINTGVDR